MVHDVSLLYDDELADLRADLELSLTDAFVVLRPSATDNGGGRQGVVFAEQPAGRWPYARTWNKQSPKDMAEAILGGAQAGQVKTLTLWYVLLPWDADVQAADRIKVAGMVLEVTGDDGGRTDAIGQTVICREMK